MGFIANDVTSRGLLERRAVRDPHRVYLVHSGRSLTFSELDAAVNRLANGLAARGIGEGMRVAVMLDNHPDLVCLFFAEAEPGKHQQRPEHAWDSGVDLGLPHADAGVADPDVGGNRSVMG